MYPRPNMRKRAMNLKATEPIFFSFGTIATGSKWFILYIISRPSLPLPVLVAADLPPHEV